MRGDLQEGHFYASRCHLPIFPSTKSAFLCALPVAYLLRRWDCGTEEDAAALGLRHGRGRAALATMGWCRSEEAAAKGAPSGGPQSCAGERLMAAPWQSTIGKQQSTIGKPQGTIGKMRGDTIGKQENSYAVRRMSRPLMPM